MEASGPAQKKSTSLWGGRLRRIVRRLRQRPVFAQAYLVRYPIDLQRDQPAPLPGLEVREITLADQPALLELFEHYGNPITLERLRARLERGKRCFAAYLDGRLASYVWVALDVIRVADLFADEPVPADAIYLFNANTLPDLRGCGVYPYLKTVVTRRMAAQTGRTVILSVILSHNRASLRASAKLGGRPVLHRMTLRLFGCSFRLERNLEHRR